MERTIQVFRFTQDGDRLVTIKAFNEDEAWKKFIKSVHGQYIIDMSGLDLESFSLPEFKEEAEGYGIECESEEVEDYD